METTCGLCINLYGMDNWIERVGGAVGTGSKEGTSTVLGTGTATHLYYYYYFWVVFYLFIFYFVHCIEKFSYRVVSYCIIS